MNPRIQKPQKGNKYYINTKDGGYNGAWGNPLRLNKDLTALPNCVAIYGWFNEIGDQGPVYLKAPWYPFSVIAAAKREGLEVTQEPTLGGIMVWTGGKTGEGHVAGVGEVISESKVLTVESEYYGRDWATFWREKGDGHWRDGCYWMGASYKYQGCIKNPWIGDDEVIKDITIYNKDTQKTATVRGIYKEGRNYLCLSDLADMGVLTATYDLTTNTPVVGKKDAPQQVTILDVDNGETVSVTSYYVNGRNHVQLNDLANMGVLRVGYDVDGKMPWVGKA